MARKLLNLNARVSEVDDTSDRLIALYKDETALQDDAFLVSLFGEIKQLSDKVTEAIKHDVGVPMLKKAARARDRAVTVLGKVIEGYAVMPIEKVKASGEQLAKVYKAHRKDMLSGNYSVKSSHTESLLKEYAKDEYKAAIKQLTGVKECIDELQKAQTDFQEKRLAYEKYAALQLKDSSATDMKKPLVELINTKLYTYISAMRIANPEEYKHFADAVEKIIADTNTAIKQRSSRRKTKGRSSKDSQ